MGEDHSLGVTRRTTGIEYAHYVIVACLGIQTLDLLLPWKAIAHSQKIIEIDRHRVVGRDAHIAVEDNDLLQSMTDRKQMSRSIILLLVAGEYKSDIGIIHDERYLVLA